MKKTTFFQDLVVNYRSFMEVKFSDKHQAFKLGIQLQSVIGYLIMLGIGISIGIWTNQIENVYYVFFMMNTVIIGSFVINKVSLERKIRAKNKLTYDFKGEVIYQTFTLTGILSIGQLFIFLFHTYTSKYMLIIVILLFLVGISNYVCRFIYKFVLVSEPHRIIRNGIMLYFILLFSRYAFGVSSFAISYVIILQAALIIYLMKYAFTLLPNDFTNLYMATTMIVGVIFLIGFILKHPMRLVLWDMEIDYIYMTESDYNVDRLLPYYSSEEETFIYYETDNYNVKYYALDDVIEVYDKEGNFVFDISEDEFSIRSVQEFDNRMLFNLYYEEEIYLEYNDTYMTTTVFHYYRINDDGELEVIPDLDPDESVDFYDAVADDYYSIFGYWHDDPYLLLHQDGGFTSAIYNEEGPNEEILSSEHKIFLRKDNTFIALQNAYSNGYLLDVQESQGNQKTEVRLYSVEDYLNDGPYESLMVDQLDKVEKLYVSDDYFVIILSEDIFIYSSEMTHGTYTGRSGMYVTYVYDRDFNLLHKAVSHNYDSKSVEVYDGDLTYSYKYILDSSNPFTTNISPIPKQLRLDAGLMIIYLVFIGNLLVIPKGWWMD